MNTGMSAEAIDVGAVVRERIERAGGVDLLRESVEDPQRRADVGRMLTELGIWDIDPASDPVEIEIAAEVCRSVGYFAVPYPVVERLTGSPGQAVALVSRTGSRLIPHLDLELGWSGIDMAGRRYAVSRANAHGSLGTQLAPFGVEAEAELVEGSSPRDAALGIVLQAWSLLGLLEHAVEDTVRYTREREQFGRALSKFQSVAFQLSDMALETSTTLELAKYAAWVLAHSDDSDEVLIEALGLRVASQRAAGVVMRGAHQLHGAMGFTDEVDVSWLSRASQTARRLPEDSQRTAGVLLAQLESVGYPELGHVTGRTHSPARSGAHP